MTEIALPETSESSKVESWRLHVLIEAGYPLLLAERLAHVGDAGAQRLERRLTDATTALERQRDEWMNGLDGRVAELEADVRRRLEDLGADAEAERAVLEARLQELVRRFDATALRGPS